MLFAPVAPSMAPNRCSSGPVLFRSSLQAMEILAALVSAFSWPLRTLADDFIAWLLAVVRNRVALGAAIVGFSAAGLGMIIWSHAVTGWWQAALLGFGTSLLIVGTVELGVLGVLNKMLEPKDPAVRTMNDFIEDFARWANQPGSGLPEFPRPAGCTDDGGA